MEPVKLQVAEDFRKKRKQMLIVAAVSIMIATAAYFVTFSDSTNTVNVISVELHTTYTGSSSGYFGQSVQYLTANYETLYSGDSYSYTITLTNQGTSAHTVNSITCGTQGFSITSFSQNLPLTIQPGTSQKITLIIQLPDFNFSGNLNISVSAS